MEQIRAKFAAIAVLKMRWYEVRAIDHTLNDADIQKVIKDLDEACFRRAELDLIYQYAKDVIVNEIEGLIKRKDRDMAPKVFKLYCPSDVALERLQSDPDIIPGIIYVRNGDYVEMRLDIKVRPTIGKYCGPVSSAVSKWLDYIEKPLPKKMFVTVRDEDKIIREVEVEVSKDNTLLITL